MTTTESEKILLEKFFSNNPVRKNILKIKFCKWDIRT